VAFGGGQAEARGLSFGPAPAGFDMGLFDIGERDPSALSERGCCFWLSDTRLDASGAERVFTSRLVQQVTGSDGLQPAASFEAAFNPSYERLVIHGIRVWRDGAVREAARPEAFELFRRELNLERAVYDGRLTAHMIVPDVRVGDVVDTAFSIIGGNPVLKGSLSISPRLQWSSPVIETRVEVRIPASRAVSLRPFGRLPKLQDVTTDGVRTLRWIARDLGPWRHEADAPPWHAGFASVHVTDTIGWDEVAGLFSGFYEPPAQLPETLETATAGIMAAEPTPAGRAAAGLRFVQGALRYHSVGVGDGGYRPRPVETIWETRYGDCKDASRLLVAVLRRMGVEAVPALVNTRIGPDLENEPPNATAFDHCIVRVTIDGEAWWVDPTQSSQGGDLANLTRPRHGWSLPLVAGATLERMREGEIPTVCATREIWTFDKQASMPARLEMRTVYRDWRADDMRRWLANDGRRNVSRRFRESLEAEYGQVVEAGPLEIIDGAADNRLEVVELYDVDRPFKALDPGRMRFVSRDDVIGPNLRDIETARRTEPIDLGAPRRVMTERVFNLPAAIHIQPWKVERAGPGTFLRSALEWRSARQAVHTLDLTVTRRIVPATLALDHFAAVREARDFNGVSFGVAVKKGRVVALDGQAPHNDNWIGWAILALIGAFLIAGWVMQGG
jgi:transglutaminase-like putative cysteine protease